MKNVLDITITYNSGPRVLWQMFWFLKQYLSYRDSLSNAWGIYSLEIPEEFNGIHLRVEVAPKPNILSLESEMELPPVGSHETNPFPHPAFGNEGDVRDK